MPTLPYGTLHLFVETNSHFLPPELYQTIIEHYSEVVLPHSETGSPHGYMPETKHVVGRHKALRPLLFASKATYREATCLIYRSTCIDLQEREGRGFQLLRMIAISPHITEHIVKFGLTVTTTPEVLEREHIGDGEVKDLLLACLQRMPRLTSWTLSHAAGALPLILQSLLRDERPFRLTCFHLFCQQEADPFLWQFVQSQEYITSFGYASYAGDSYPIPPSDVHLLPRVADLRVPGPMACSILRTRPRPTLKSLRIDLRRAPDTLPWTNTGSIQSLSIVALGRPPSEVITTISAFRNLENVFLVVKYSAEWVGHYRTSLSKV